MRRIVVYHSHYGCDTGCCGHVVEILEPDDEFDPYSGDGRFAFDHAFSGDEVDRRKFAEDLIREKYGEDHVRDLDWESCKEFVVTSDKCW